MIDEAAGWVGLWGRARKCLIKIQALQLTELKAHEPGTAGKQPGDEPRPSCTNGKAALHSRKRLNRRGKL